MLAFAVELRLTCVKHGNLLPSETVTNVTIRYTKSCGPSGSAMKLDCQQAGLLAGCRPSKLAKGVAAVTAVCIA